MLFSSYVFLFAFLPAALAGFCLLSHWLGPKPAKLWLTFTSLIFYGWWNPIYVLLIVASMLFNFWLGREGTSFLGSTPELLVRVEGQTVTSGALGGSAPRGADDEEDRVLGDSLLASAKNLEEHEYVVSAVRSALGSVAGPLYSVERPRLMRLPEAQHLYTPVQGRLRERRSALEVAGLLHPTPAVCGVPRETARAIIEREEPHRGWYTGAVGWMDAGGGGEFAVALRSGLVDRSRMFLWAGAGIVAGSDPEAEFAETETKFSALFRSASIGSAA